MIRSLLIDFVFPLLLFLLLRSLLGNFMRGSRSKSVEPRAPQSPVSHERVADLKKDPVCGTYVSTDASVTRSVKGEVIYFCSKECRDRFVA